MSSTSLRNAWLSMELDERWSLAADESSLRFGLVFACRIKGDFSTNPRLVANQSQSETQLENENENSPTMNVHTSGERTKWLLLLLFLFW